MTAPTKPKASQVITFLRRLRLVMRVISIIWVILTPILIVVLQMNIDRLDVAVVNLATFVIGSLGLYTAAVLIAFGTNLPPVLRFAPGVILLSLYFTMFVVFRVERVSGGLIPEFRLRWQKSPDEFLVAPEVTQPDDEDGGVQLVSTSPLDFHQFLGPNRDAYVDHVKLATDWTREPPAELWRQPVGAGWTGFVTSNDFAVTLEQRGEAIWVTCYRVASGELVWAHQEAGRHVTVMGGIGPRSTPLIDDGDVYALLCGSETTDKDPGGPLLLCLDGSSGDVKWRHYLLSLVGSTLRQEDMGVAWGRANSPLAVDDLIVVPGGGIEDGNATTLIAFEKASGKIAWRSGTRQASYSSPMLMTLYDKRQIVSVNESTISGHDPSKGSVLWEYPWPGKSNSDASVSQPQQVGPTRLFLSKGYGVGAALLEFEPKDDGPPEIKEVWRNEMALRTKFTNSVIFNGYAYALSDGILECISLESGERQWKKGRFGQGQILGVSDVLLVQAERGDLVMVRLSPERFQELSRYPAFESQTWNNLCLDGNRLLLRNGEEAVCLALPLVEE